MKTGAMAFLFVRSDTVITAAMCPSDELSPKTFTASGPGGASPLTTQGFSGNYVACTGSEYLNKRLSYDTNPLHVGNVSSAHQDGMYFARKKETQRGGVKASEVIDGLSRTIAFSEITLVADIASPPRHDVRGRYYNPVHGGVSFTTLNPPNTTVQDRLPWCDFQSVTNPCLLVAQDFQISARSYHPGVVNAARVDGSVATIEDGVDLLVYQAAGSRNRGDAN
jgi:hypothetical protein